LLHFVSQLIYICSALDVSISVTVGNVSNQAGQFKSLYLIRKCGSEKLSQ